MSEELGPVRAAFDAFVAQIKASLASKMPASSRGEDDGVCELINGQVPPSRLSGAVSSEDSRLTDAREWTAQTISQADAEAGIATEPRKWTAQRVRQAVEAWWNGSSYKTKLDGIQAGAQANTVISVAGKTGAVSLNKADVGLPNVDNVADLDKPISTATQTALNGKLGTGANAASATKLQNARTIGGVAFDGTANINLPGVNAPGNQNTSGSAATLTTGRTIAMTGDVFWTSPAFNGSSNVTAAATLANSGVVAGTYGKVTVDVKGRVIAGEALAAADIPALPVSKITDLQSSLDAKLNVADLSSSVSSNSAYTAATSSAVKQAYDLANAALPASQKGANNGVASLDASGKVPAAQLPSYVDDVLEFAALANFPATGESSKIYIAIDSGKIYRWTGSVYVNIGANASTADAATKLATARTINGTPFDGTANITVTDNTKEPAFAAGTTAQYRRGDKTWQDFATAVRAAVLTGFSTASSAAVVATDTVLTALGKLQAQLGNKQDKVAGKGLSTEDFTTAEKSKLSAISAGATANATDAELRDRATHTGTQAISTITNLTTELAAKLDASGYTAADVLAKLKTVDGAGSGLDADTLDGLNSSAFATAAQGAKADTAVQPGALGTSASRNVAATGDAAATEVVLGSDTRLSNAREWIASAVTQAEAEAGTATTTRKWTAQRVRQAILGWWNASAEKTKLDGIQTGATANATNAQLRDRSTHTGTQATSTISGLDAALTARRLKDDTLVAGVAGVREIHNPVQFAPSGGIVTGTIKITLPVGFTSTMMRLAISGFEYLSGKSAWELILGGYNFSTNNLWANTSAFAMGRLPFTSVRFGFDGSKCCILLGTTSTQWSYPKVIIDKVTLTFSGVTQAWDSGWSMSLITDETGITVSGVPTIYSHDRVIAAEKLHTPRLINKRSFSGESDLIIPAFVEELPSTPGFLNDLAEDGVERIFAVNGGAAPTAQGGPNTTNGGFIRHTGWHSGNGAVASQRMDEGLATPGVYWLRYKFGTWTDWVRYVPVVQGDWIDLRPYLASGLFWKTEREGKNPHPRARRINDVVEFSGVVSYNATAGVPLAGVVFENLPAILRPQYTIGGAGFADTASPLWFGTYTWFMGGAVAYGGAQPGEMKAVSQDSRPSVTDGAICLDGIRYAVT